MYDTDLANFQNGNLNDLATLIAQRAGMTLEYMQVTWDAQDAGTDEYGTQMWLISNMFVGLVVTTTTAGNGNAILNAFFYSDWWSNIIRNTNPDSSFIEAILNPCQTGYHWDPNTNACVLNACPTGTHWDVATQQCIVDTINNCPIGYHWNAATNSWVLDVVPPPPTEKKPFPWIPVAVGVAAVSAVAVGGYYLYTRRKHRKSQQTQPPLALPML